MAKKTARKKSPAKAKKAAKKPAKKAARKAARRPARAAASAAPDAGYSPPRLVGPSVVHWEVQARDPVAQREFFGSLFGWNVDANNPQNYGMVPSGGEGAIGGGIGPAPESKPYVTFYVEVPDIGAALARAGSLGASTVMPRTDMGMVILAQFRDPEGNLVGLIESSAS